MPFLPDPIPIQSDDPEASKAYSAMMSSIFSALKSLSLTQRSGAIQHNDKAGNLNARYIVFTSNGTANTEDTVTHALGYAPSYFIPVSQNKAGSLYLSSTPATSTAIYLKTSAASVTWTVMVF